MKGIRRRRIYIPKWHISELEMWFTHMSRQKWSLKEIVGKYAIFEQIGLEYDQYYCCIHENDTNGEQRCDKKRQVDEIERLGWQYVTNFYQVEIYRISSLKKANYPLTLDNKARSIVAYFNNCKGKIEIPWIIIILTIIVTLFGLYRTYEYLTSPLLYLAVLLIIYTLLKVPFNILWRIITIRRLRSSITKERQQHCYFIINAKHCMKYMLILFILFLLFLPIIPYGVQFIQYGYYPPFPEGGIYLARLGDFKSEFQPINAGDIGTSRNFYRAYPSLLLPMTSMIFESDKSSHVFSLKYNTIAPWYAKILAKSLPLYKSLCDQEVAHPEIFGFQKIWFHFDEKNDGSNIVIAIKDSIVYQTSYSGIMASLEEILTVMKDKAYNLGTK